MVYLSRIYTKSGDQGETGLGDGSRVPKNHPRVAAYGGGEGHNAGLGLLLAPGPGPPAAEPGCGRQNEPFDGGPALWGPPDPAQAAGQARLRVQPAQAKRREEAIDRLNASLAPLHSFILPGGSPAAAWCHLARTVCRRAERDVVTLAQREPI